MRCEISKTRSEAVQGALVQALAKGRDIRNDLDVYDMTIFGEIGIAEDLEQEGRCRNLQVRLRSYCWKGFIGRSICGAIGSRTRRRRQRG